MRVEVVRDIGIDSSPGLESLELGFRLGHVAEEETKVGCSV